MKKKISYEEKINENLKVFRDFLQIDQYNIDNVILPRAVKYIDNIDNFYDEEDRQEHIKSIRKTMANFNINEDKYWIDSDCSNYHNPYYRCYRGDVFYRTTCPFIWAWAQCIHIMELRRK